MTPKQRRKRKGKRKKRRELFIHLGSLAGERLEKLKRMRIKYQIESDKRVQDAIGKCH